MLRSNRYPLILILAVALMGITFLGPTASPAQAADLVVNVTGEVVLFGTFDFQLGATARGAADALTGRGFDAPIEGAGGEGGLGHDYCHFPLTGSLSGSVVTLTGTVTSSNNPADLGAAVTIIADASTGAITYDFDGVVLTGTGKVTIAPG
jgi:opacity protein-like surface antigen